MKTLKHEVLSRLELAAGPSSYRAEAKRSIKTLYKYLEETGLMSKAEKNIPQSEMQNDFKSLKYVSDVCIRADKPKGALLARQCYGLLILCGSITPF